MGFAEEQTEQVKTTLTFDIENEQVAYLHCWATYFQNVIHNIKLVTVVLRQYIKLQYCCLCRAMWHLLHYFLVTLDKMPK